VAIPQPDGSWRRLAGDEIGWLFADYILANTSGDDRLVVTTLADPGIPTDGQTSLREALAYAAALLPFVVVLHGRPDAGRGLGAIVLAGRPIVPLWFVALDWGRWVNAHVSVMVFLVLILRRRGRLPDFDAPLPRVLFLGTLAVCLGVGMRHVGGSIRAGLIEVAWRTFGAPGL
jgi:hypothetical protein